MTAAELVRADPWTDRIAGIDLARFVAVAGMVIVHARTELVLLPLEQRSPDEVITIEPEPTWAWVLQAIFTDRARPLFILLAGLGLTLFAQRSRPTPSVILRRAGFLAALGVGLALIGWTDFILVYYGIWFIWAIGLLKLPSWALIVAAAAFVALPVAVSLAGAGPDDAALSVALILGETSFFCLGLVLGRLTLQQPRTWLLLLAVGATLAVPTLGYLIIHDASSVGVRLSGLDLLAEQLSTCGIVTITLVGCLALGQIAHRAPVVRVLATTGSMPLSLYVAQALMFILLTRVFPTTLGPATLVSLAFLVVAVVAAQLWARTHRSGPVEALMRRASRPRRSAT